MKISNYYENLNIWLEILLKIKPKEKNENIKLLRNPQNFTGNPFKNEKYENLRFWLQTTPEIGYF